MLWADKRALETNLKLSLLEIRERELNLYTNNCMNISVIAALFAGFSYCAFDPGVSLGDAADREVGALAKSQVARQLYLVSALCALGLQILSLVSSTLLSMLAPGLGLRGPDGSMHTAVDEMKGEYQTAVYYLLFGMCMMLISVALYCWIQFPAVEASILTVINLLVFAVIQVRIREAFSTFALPKELEVTGKYEAEEATHAGADAGVVSKGELDTLSHLIRREQHLKNATSAATNGKVPATSR